MRSTAAHVILPSLQVAMAGKEGKDKDKYSSSVAEMPAKLLALKKEVDGLVVKYRKGTGLTDEGAGRWGWGWVVGRAN